MNQKEHYREWFSGLKWAEEQHKLCGSIDQVWLYVGYDDRPSPFDAGIQSYCEHQQYIAVINLHAAISGESPVSQPALDNIGPNHASKETETSQAERDQHQVPLPSWRRAVVQSLFDVWRKIHSPRPS